MRIVALTIKKGSERTQVDSIQVSPSEGIIGDDNARDKEKWVSILDMNSRRFIEENKGKGLCYGRFVESITVSEPTNLDTGKILKSDEVQMLVSDRRKKCFKECNLNRDSEPCPLRDNARYLDVRSGGTLKKGATILILILTMIFVSACSKQTEIKPLTLNSECCSIVNLADPLTITKYLDKEGIGCSADGYKEFIKERDLVRGQESMEMYSNELETKVINEFLLKKGLYLSPDGIETIVNNYENGICLKIAESL